MVRYMVVASHALPQFDPTKTVKDALFSRANARVVSLALRQYAPVISVSYFLGIALAPIVIFAPASVAQYVGIAEMLLELPAYITALLTLRTDLVKLLVVSYDYWFFAAATLVYTVSFSLLVQDLRLVLITSRLIGYQLPILIDANLSKTKLIVVSMVVNIVLTLLTMSAVSLDAVPGMVDEGATSPGSFKRSLSVRDLLANALMTLEILFLRIVIRKYGLTKSMKVAPTPAKPELSVATIKCVTMRCLLKLDTIDPAAPCTASRPMELVGSIHSVQLRHTASDLQYESTDIVLPSILQLRCSPLFCTLLHTIGFFGIVLTFACGGLMMLLNQLRPSPLLTTITTGAIVSTGSYLGVLLLYSNRKLLLSVCLSFDFLFLSLQITFAHACICDMFAWRPIPSVIAVCMLLWFHWVLTLDALTPHMKQRLRFSHSRRIALVFLVVYLLSQSIFLLTGFLADMWPLENRAVVSVTIFRKHLEFNVLPFFVSRMMTVLVWTGRLIWRFGSQDEPNTLIMLRGQVEFDSLRSGRPSLFVRLKTILSMPVVAAGPKRLDTNNVATSESLSGKH